MQKAILIRRFALAAAACISLVTGSAFAQTFSGTTDGTFANPQPSTGVTYTGVGTSEFTWGVADGTPTPNILQYTPVAGGFNSVPAETPFSMGTLFYYNGTTESGTTPNSVDLDLALHFTDPAGINQTFTYDMTLISTPNTGDAEQNADYVVLNTVPSETFTSGGTTYTVSLGFSGVEGSDGFGFLNGQNEFFVEEGDSATADLVGTITTNLEVPEPTTVITGALMLLPFGASTLRFVRKNRAA